jgi:hypothetical protein
VTNTNVYCFREHYSLFFFEEYMDSEKYYLRVARKFGYFLSFIFLLVAVGGIYEGYKEAHNDTKTTIS